MKFFKSLLDELKGNIVFPRIATKIVLPPSDGSINFSSIDKFNNPNSPFGKIGFYGRGSNDWIKEIKSLPTEKIFIDIFGDLNYENQFKGLDTICFEDIIRKITNRPDSVALTPNQILDCIRLHKRFLYNNIKGQSMSFVFFIKLNNNLDLHLIRAWGGGTSITLFDQSTQERDIRIDDLIVLPSIDNLEEISIKRRK